MSHPDRTDGWRLFDRFDDAFMNFLLVMIPDLVDRTWSSLR